MQHHITPKLISTVHAISSSRNATSSTHFRPSTKHRHPVTADYTLRSKAFSMHRNFLDENHNSINATIAIGECATLMQTTWNIYIGGTALWLGGQDRPKPSGHWKLIAEMRTNAKQNASTVKMCGASLGNRDFESQIA